MGIKNLADAIKRFDPDNQHMYCLDPTSLAGTRIAYDISGIIYRYKSKNEESWQYMVKAVLLNAKNQGITPIVVFDGAPPEEKAATMEARGANKAKQDDRIHKIKAAYEYYMLSGEIDPILDFACIDGDLQHKLVGDKLRKGSVTILDEDVRIVQTICHDHKIQYYFSKTEAETLCCKLVVCGEADLVLSNDSDNLAYPITGYIDTNRSTKEMYVFRCRSTLQKILGLTATQFLEYCIMLGTDYNMNIPKVGAVNALKLLKQYGSIDAIPHSEKACLCHIAVKSIFSLEGPLEDYIDMNRAYSVPVLRPI